MTDSKETVVRAYKEYFAAFQTLDPRAVVPYYHVPCLSISAAGVSVMNTPGDVEASFARMMERLKKLGYGRSEFSDIRATMLSEDLAQLSIRGARFKSDGELLEPLGVTYTLRKTHAGWKVVVLMQHNPDVLSHFPS